MKWDWDRIEDEAAELAENALRATADFGSAETFQVVLNGTTGEVELYHAIGDVTPYGVMRGIDVVLFRVSPWDPEGKEVEDIILDEVDQVRERVQAIAQTWGEEDEGKYTPR